MDDIKLIVSEVEGVITDGTQPIDELGNTSFKEYYTPDFEAINKLKVICPFVFLSTDNVINYNFFKRKNIPFYWAKKDKSQVLLEIMRRYNVSADNTLYIGSKLSDISCIRMVPNSLCTNEFIVCYYGSDNIKGFNCPPGKGVLTELFLDYFYGRKDANKT